MGIFWTSYTTLVVVLITGASALVANPLAQATEGTSSAAGCEPTYVPNLGLGCELPNGHYLVFLDDGTTLITHGPDPIVPDAEPGFGETADQRAPVCAAEWNLHVLYGHPASVNSRIDTVASEIRGAIRRMNAILNADALESGNVGADFRVLCDANGDIQIDVFTGPDTAGPVYTTDFTAVVNAAKAAGFSNPTTDYLMFYDDTSQGVCGVGNLATDDSLSETNANMQGPDYGVVYKNCFLGRTPMHENGHTQGAVQDLAPMWDGSGHCLEGEDVMCYPGQGGVLPLCDDRVHYDCNFDTYFDAAPENGEWLATHWNIGSRLNKYIAFSDAPAPSAPTEPSTAPPSPPPSTTSSRPPSSTNTAPQPSFTAESNGRTLHVDASGTRDPQGDAIDYEWNWGDGQGGDFGEKQSHIYSADGTFVVTLTATDAFGASRTVQRQIAIDDGVANKAPTAAFSIDPKDPRPGGEVQFIDLSSDHDGRVVMYEWSFGDGTTSDKRYPRRTFFEGTYSIELTVTDDQGATDSLVQPMVVEKPEEPAAEPLAAPESRPPETVPGVGLVYLVAVALAMTGVRRRSE